MKNRALKSLSKEISSISENINTWAVSLKHLIKLRRKLLNNKKADSDLYMVADAFSKLFYKNQAKVNEYHLDSDSESDSDSKSDSESDSPRSTRQRRDPHDQKDHQKDCSEDQEEDIDETLRKIIASEAWISQSDNQPLPKNLKITPMQKAALDVLTAEEQEAKDLASRMARKREKLARDMNKPQPRAPVKFTLDVDKTLDPKTGKPIDCGVYAKDDSEDEVLDEVSIDENSSTESDSDAEEIPQENKKDIKHPSAVDLETALNNVMKNVLDDTSLHPIIAMQKENPLFNGLPGFENTTEHTPQPQPQPQNQIQKNITQESYDFDPKYGPLLKLSAYARKQLQYKWFTQAKQNVDAHIAEHPVSPRTRDRLIREETTRLQDLYCETH